MSHMEMDRLAVLFNAMGLNGSDTKNVETAKRRMFCSSNTSLSRPVGFPCRFRISNKCKHSGVCGVKYYNWGMCDYCGNWKRKHRVNFKNNV